ncbi:hypothetical protein F4802DRAFT_366273 [Xylaria palmicola]|nr:hypothetical protein F4802DRAFT_366273 [Xylaria palmicola]
METNIDRQGERTSSLYDSAGGSNGGTGNELHFHDQGRPQHPGDVPTPEGMHASGITPWMHEEPDVTQLGHHRDFLSPDLPTHGVSQLQKSPRTVNTPYSPVAMLPVELDDSTNMSRDLTYLTPTIYDNQNVPTQISNPPSPILDGAISDANTIYTVNDNNPHLLWSIHAGLGDNPHSASRRSGISQHSAGLTEAASMGPDTDAIPSHHDKPPPRPEVSTSTASWKPSYLDWRLLLCFSALFGSTLIAIEIVTWISSQRHGLATSQPQLHYLWKYGTTAVFTLITTFWTRIEYNVKAIAPWSQLSSGPKDANRTVLLDYISPFPTTAIYQAVRYKDFYVVAAILVTIALRVLIILSTSLITLVPVLLELHEVPATLLDTFRTTAPDEWPLPDGGVPDGLTGTVKAQVYLGLTKGEHPYPIGLTESLAYQDFSVDLDSVEDLTLAVDAFSGMLECRESNYISLLPGMRILPSSYYSQTVEAENCTYTLNLTFPEELSETQYYGRVLLSSCKENAVVNDTSFNYPPESKLNYTLQILAMEMTHNEELNNATDKSQGGFLTKLMERTCFPSFVIRNVSVTRSTGQNDSLSIMEQEPRPLPKTNPWSGFADLNYLLNNNCTHGGCLNRFFGGYCDTSCELNTTVISNKGTDAESIALDGFLAFALRENVDLSPTKVAEQFFNSTFIDDSMDRLFVSYGAYLGYLLFRDQANSATTNATVTTKSDRLLVSPTIAHAMGGLLGLCLILSLSMIALLPKRDILPPPPTTIIDMAILARQSQSFIQSLRGLGASSEKNMRSQMHLRSYKLDLIDTAELDSKKVFMLQVDSEWSPEHHNDRVSGDGAGDNGRYPLVLHPAARLVITSLLAAIIIALEIMLRQSERDRGLMDVGSGDYVQYGWMFLPAIILSLISLYYGAVEFQMRLLAPYQNLSLGAPSRATLFLDLQDKLSVTAFVAAIRSRQFAVAVAILAAFTTSFLTIAAASLFSVQQASANEAPAQLLPRDMLDYAASWSSRAFNSSSLLAANLDYPAFTFRDLVYPSLRWNESIGGDSSNSSLERDVHIEANIPAARSSLNCTIYRRPHLEATLGALPSASEDGHYIHVKFPEKNCTGLVDSFLISIKSLFTTQDFYFGIAMPGSSLLFSDFLHPDDRAPGSDNPDNVVGCSSYLYAWGQVSNWTDNGISSIVGMGCDEQMQEVNTRLTLFGPDLEIRRDHPPQIDNSTTHAVVHAPKGCEDKLFDPCDDLKNLYEDLEDVITSEALDTFFSALTFPGGKLALDQSLLGNESMAQSVADAVIFQHQVLRGQAFSASSRIPVKTPDSTSTTVSLSDSGGLSFPANVSVVSQTASRIVQDALATRILEALLGAVLALSCLSWIASPNTKVLPRSPVSIASVVAWFADGDILDSLPHDAHEMTRSDLEAFFEDEYFYMRMDRRGRLGICSALATFRKERTGLNRNLSMDSLLL